MFPHSLTVTIFFPPDKATAAWYCRAAEEVTQEEKDDIAATEKAISEQKDKKKEVIAAYAKDNAVIHQLIDLALLRNGMLKGAALEAFLKRSVEMIKG